MAKYIFVAGGVMSGIGKGVATASIGRILKSKGFGVTAIKIDPYINVDAGTMNPIEHGEVFVTEDGLECDQDIGNYERFLEENIYTDNYMTTGKVYQTVINRERNLEYNGRCVEVVPDIPNEVIATIKRAGKKVKADFVLIEIGGTVGEYQNMLFLEAARMLKISHPKDVLFILVSYMPVPAIIGEMKTKPTQYAVRTLNSAGIQPDMILARSVLALDEPRKRKLSISSNVLPEDIISAPDVTSIYEVPINFEKENLGNRILKKFGLKARASDLKKWENFVKIIKNSPEPVEIGIVGKYFESGKFTLTDSYISVLEAVKHACFAQHRKPKITWISAEEFEKNPATLKKLKNFDGIIVPGGFGNRGIEGKIKAIGYCRKNKIPFLGLCLGMQLSVIEFARNVCGLKDATSAEFKENSDNMVIDVMEDQKMLLEEKRYGGTMRLGSYSCELKPKTISLKAYGTPEITERHRHRYELNNSYRSILEKKGMVIAGVNPQKDLVEIIEIRDHPFFVATQFHPEFKSRPLNPHPLFKEFIKAAIKK
ncbi:MAG: CTP synthase [Candidatus Staskawiczbacteria bacterium RIFCSPLOWO2_01_FULL_40_39]|uniref:CTP synthase n=1 Tax=Candidatus Staskawiczbacteria bacterium RIFCSPHIGHO2_01_FULL_39_25 TaxID=1802202 RepID=A0A1G2HM64_9BACT|nr:MAG: CTP synthase [Candidatus Staskawiczbacteria bacterium RIFCSPHIGHO2_01_FULL_39_25]OGZ73673.1 MAG: CTP synthase [Candidatus Staskawiczbacteria bacterium RIFCSPLOWO2_01_FULL_40_39]